MPDNMGDTDQKITYKDHDILVSLHTLVDQLVKQRDEDRRAEADRNQQLALELKTVAVEQARITSTLQNFERDRVSLERRIEKLETKSNMWDTINSFGVLVSAYVGYIFGNR